MFLFVKRIRAMENELKDKVKVDRGLLNSWFMEVQDTKVNFSELCQSRFRYLFVRRKKLIDIESGVDQLST